MTRAERAAETARPSWRAGGLRRWLPVGLLACFLLQSLIRLADLVAEPPPQAGDVALLALNGSCVVVGTFVVAVTWRTRVTLDHDGIEVRGGRRRLIRYADVVRAHRDRFNRGAVSLELADGSRVVLPAPLAGLKDPAPELAEAVALIQARVDAARSAVGGGAAG